jgi:hypothetical protein
MLASKSFASRLMRLIRAKNRSNHPASGDDGEADLVVGLPHHLDADRAGIRNPSAGIAAICVAQRHERPTRT